MRHAPASTFTASLPIPAQGAVPPSRVAAAVARLVWLIGLPGRVAAARRTLAQLGGMSASELADIGLVRQDVRDAAALPLGRDPGRLWSARAAERRRAERARR